MSNAASCRIICLRTVEDQKAELPNSYDLSVDRRALIFNMAIYLSQMFRFSHFRICFGGPSTLAHLCATRFFQALQPLHRPQPKANKNHTVPGHLVDLQVLGQAITGGGQYLDRMITQLDFAVTQMVDGYAGGAWIILMPDRILRRLSGHYMHHLPEGSHFAEMEGFTFANVRHGAMRDQAEEVHVPDKLRELIEFMELMELTT